MDFRIAIDIKNADSINDACLEINRKNDLKFHYSCEYRTNMPMINYSTAMKITQNFEKAIEKKCSLFMSWVDSFNIRFISFLFDTATYSLDVMSVSLDVSDFSLFILSQTRVILLSSLSIVIMLY